MDFAAQKTASQFENECKLLMVNYFFEFQEISLSPRGLGVVKLASLLHAPRGEFWANKRTPAPAQVITKKVKSKKGYTPREAFALVDRTPRT